MKFVFENLGALDKAEIELAPLTIVSGPNNMGKTYLSYAIAAYLKTWEHFFDIDISLEDIKKLGKEGVLEIDLDKSYAKHIDTVVEKASKKYISNLHQFLGAEEGRFAKTTMKAILPNPDLSAAFKKDYRSEKGKTVVSFVKQQNSSLLKITAVSEKKEPFFSVPEEMIADAIKEILWGQRLPRPFIVSTERTGAVTFRGELNLAKNRLIELANDIKTYENFSPMKLIRTVFDTGYPMPVNDNVDFLNQLNKIETKQSPLIEKNPEIMTFLNALVGGEYRISKEGQIGFVTSKGKYRLKIAESSSSVRSLVILWYYLKHVAKQNDLLIIDEPELNLHPENQRIMARLLAKLVRCGIRVLVTTHSDYLIKEINTMLMLNCVKDKASDIKQKYGYASEDTLAPENVRLYMICSELTKLQGNERKTRATILKKAEIDPELGLEVETFDRTIDEMNKIQSLLFDIISDDVGVK